jgi:hypothetical protein
MGGRLVINIFINSTFPGMKIYNSSFYVNNRHTLLLLRAYSRSLLPLKLHKVIVSGHKNAVYILPTVGE